MKLRSGLVLVFVSTTAYAQAPGEVAPSPYDPAPVACGECVDPMQHRFAIGLSIGGLGVAPDGAPEGTEAQFRIGELALRYRATRRLELELAMSGGRQVLEDNTDGDLAMGTVTLGLRYRFMPEHRWSWWILGGFGGTVIAPHQSSEQERDGATRPLGMLGIGLERRFGQLVIQAEVRGFGLGAREDAMGVVPVRGGIGTGGGAPVVPKLPATYDVLYANELGGGVATLGAAYYF